MRTKLIGALVVALAIAAASWDLLVRSHTRLPSPDSRVYEDTTRSFYRGLAELQVGLLDDAKRDFGKAAELVPDEPAAWANLGLAHLRLGEFDAATAPIGKAVSLAGSVSDVVFLRGRLQTSRGKLDEGIADYRRAADLDADNMRVRYALAEEVERAGGANADAQAQQLFEAILTLRPGNLAVLLERARLSAKRGDAGSLRDSLRILDSLAAGWPAAAVEQYRGLQAAVAAANFQDAARSVAFLRNVLVRVPVFRESLSAVRTPTELIAEPFETFLKLPAPSARPSPIDDGLTFEREALSVPSRVPNGAVELDWNRDFKLDYAVAGKSGVRVFTSQPDGSFKDATPKAEALVADCYAVWTADIEMDGDLDLIAGVRGAAPVVLRNNGDGSWKQLRPFPGVTGLRAFAWGDIDGDGDPDAVLVGERGDLHVFENRQGGEFREMAAPGLAGIVALAVGDINADGALEIVTLGANGIVQQTSRRRGEWQTQQVANWSDAIDSRAVGDYRIFLADLDNNGALDLVVSGGGRTRMWMFDGGPERAAPRDAGRDGTRDGARDGTYVARPFQGRELDGVEVFGVADLNDDGQLDFIGTANAQPVRLLGKGTKGYHWQVMRPRAQPTAGDQRINSFAVGGEIEIRSGLLTQKQIITSQPVHFGLGTRTGIDVARIFWPNGIMQADFDRKADQSVVAEQRLKGSCPWVFTYDGNGMRFVTDFLWRSPLGLRINAVDTAGVTQTEDWVRIRGDQLVPRDGAYDVRITAELWETHFVDHVSLLVVDHPAGQDVFVDERFAREAPALAVHVLTRPVPVAQAWDESGRDVTDLVARQDGRYLATFERGDYQGIAKDHFVEIDLQSFQGRWLVANGWIYPTDSSINVAIGQQHLQPHGLSLEAQDDRGRWVVVSPDLGFPAGKNKTILVDLGRIARAGIAHPHRVRLRTNLEVYWDSLALAGDVPADVQAEVQADVKNDASGGHVAPVRVAPSVAELRYRGFSKTDVARDRPETPRYGDVANVGQRWRDLTGYYTRFGDVRELLSAVDDRYVIMNAGDELRLSFPAPAPPKAGWTRDFVLIGDGWVKDGDYNTTASKTVGPLPRHGHPDYEALKSEEVEEDPVHRAHAGDWQKYHTRFVEPQLFLSGLR
jgi:tetratricopeptide (TPR) repeat protein